MELLKNIFFQEAFIIELSQHLEKASSDFKSDSFKKILLDKAYTSLELKEKLRKCAEVIGECLELDYVDALKVLTKVAPHFEDFDSMVFPEFVDVYGQEHFEESLEALAELTKYGSSEFAIRRFIEQDTDRVLAYMAKLANHEHDYVRRFASEGCRPKLPWAIAVKSLNEPENLKKILKILEVLKSDDSLFVRKSVANNLNDISKIDKEMVLSKAKEWIGHNEHTDWILKHGLRTLLKRGDNEALALWGLNDPEGMEVTHFHLENEKPKIGDTTYLIVSFDVAETKKIRGAFNVHYLKKNGSHSVKTFAFFEKEFQAGTYTHKRKISFKEMSTRKHYAGIHKIDMVMNGEDKARIEFELGSET